MATEDPSLRDDLKGREIELWVTEQQSSWDDGETTTYLSPNIMDVKTGEFVTIDNGGESEESGSDKAAATDGGTATESTSDTPDTDSTESPDEPSTDADDNGLPGGVPEKLEDLLGFMARNNDTVSADEVRSFAADEVDDPDAIDWAAAATVATERDE